MKVKRINKVSYGMDLNGYSHKESKCYEVLSEEVLNLSTRLKDLKEEVLNLNTRLRNLKNVKKTFQFTLQKEDLKVSKHFIDLINRQEEKVKTLCTSELKEMAIYD